ncbi:hypothetical protein C2S52_001448 [Perilla frutescens var. hirtella]|nr:hypothetical protein C2S51_007057 [Perilla frutescens var. frutescens]KAH6800984.1 hypothetical protein C2S52_001448 [Perilla frutescens var. hirtella]
MSTSFNLKNNLEDASVLLHYVGTGIVSKEPDEELSNQFSQSQSPAVSPDLTLSATEKINKCTHPSWTDCTVKYIRAKLEDGGAGDIKCPAVGCGHSLKSVACAEVVGPELFVRWCDALCKVAILGRKRLLPV